MSTADRKLGAAMREWKAFGARITLFPSMPSSAPPQALDLYKQIWHADPDSFQKQQNALMPTVAQGKQGDLTVNCVVQPTRIDFNFAPTPGQGQELVVTLIDQPLELRNGLMNIVGTFDREPFALGVSRVGINLHVLSLEADHIEANKALSEVIPDRYRVTVTDEEDFVFQINQPRASKGLPDIRTNFITKWSVDRLQVLNFMIPTGGGGVSAEMASSFPQAKVFIGASVVFDSNNIPGRTLTVKESSVLLHEGFDEIVRMQREIGVNTEGF